MAGPTRAAAILLPVLIVQDAVSLWSFRGQWDRWIIGWMLPGALAGVGLGYLFAAQMPVPMIMALLGAITLGFGLWRLALDMRARQRAQDVPPSTSPGWVGMLFGVATGFTSQIAHAGGPPFQMWVAPRQLPHLRFVGTNVLLFALLNWVKVPTFIALGEFDRQVLITAAALVPLAIASTLGGVWLVKRLNTARFYTIVYMLMIALGSRLIWEGMAG